VKSRKNSQRDTGDGIEADNAGWSFDVPGNRFDEHIARSVPFYREGHDLIARLSDFFLIENSVVYDIGSTTGSLVKAILARHPNREMSITGIERVPSMVEYAADQVEDPRASFVNADALDYEFGQAHLFILYYTLQFIHPSVRIDLLKTIYERLHWGGGLLMFEKVRAPDARFQDYMSQVYKEYKLANDFTAEQILNKEQSLKGTLEPFSEAGNLTLLRESGFRDITSVFKWVCFEGFLAIK